MIICVHVWNLQSKEKLWVWRMRVFREAQKVNVFIDGSIACLYPLQGVSISCHISRFSKSLEN